MTGGRLLDVAFDAVGLKVTFEQALDRLDRRRPAGRRGHERPVPTVGPTSMFGLTQKQVLGHLGCQNVDIETLARLVSLGRLDLSRSISRIIPLADIRDGIDALEHADGNPIRILVQPYGADSSCPERRHVALDGADYDNMSTFGGRFRPPWRPRRDARPCAAAAAPAG